MKPDLPDIRIVSITTEVVDDSIGEPKINISGCGFYEAIGMLMCGLMQMINLGEVTIEDDEYPTEWDD